MHNFIILNHGGCYKNSLVLWQEILWKWVKPLWLHGHSENSPANSTNCSFVFLLLLIWMACVHNWKRERIVSALVSACLCISALSWTEWTYEMSTNSYLMDFLHLLQCHLFACSNSSVCFTFSLANGMCRTPSMALNNGSVPCSNCCFFSPRVRNEQRALQNLFDWNAFIVENESSKCPLAVTAPKPMLYGTHWLKGEDQWLKKKIDHASAWRCLAKSRLVTNTQQLRVYRVLFATWLHKHNGHWMFMCKLWRLLSPPLHNEQSSLLCFSCTSSCVASYIVFLRHDLTPGPWAPAFLILASILPCIHVGHIFWHGCPLLAFPTQSHSSSLCF